MWKKFAKWGQKRDEDFAKTFFNRNYLVFYFCGSNNSINIHEENIHEKKRIHSRYFFVCIEVSVDIKI